MTEASVGRDGHEIEALVTDRYLEALLAAHARGADHGPSASDPSENVRRTADRLGRDLPRFHPSFRFEEALAARLADLAAAMRHPDQTERDTVLIALPALDPDDEPDHGRTGSGRRPLIIGGALTSAALSLAGAAFVAWRLNRPASDPMARAARAVARMRPV
ncbi:MAG: hypothetical protein ABJC39_07455 [Chloroflexota bacterium]